MIATNYMITTTAGTGDQWRGETYLGCAAVVSTCMPSRNVCKPPKKKRATFNHNRFSDTKKKFTRDIK